MAPARGSTWSDKLWARTCCAPPELHRHRAASLGPESSELGSPAQIKAPALQQECKSALKWKGSDVCHSWLSQQGSWLSGYIPKEPQPAASPEREARPLEQTCQQQLYKKKIINVWIWLTGFLPQFCKSSPLPTILTHNIQK